MILAAAAAAAAEVLADSLIGDVVSSGEWLLLVARFPCSSSKNNNRNSNRNRNNNNNRNQEDPAVFTVQRPSPSWLEIKNFPSPESVASTCESTLLRECLGERGSVSWHSHEGSAK